MFNLRDAQTVSIHAVLLGRNAAFGGCSKSLLHMQIHVSTCTHIWRTSIAGQLTTLLGNLLQGPDYDPSLKVREWVGEGFYVENLDEVAIESEDDLQLLFERVRSHFGAGDFFSGSARKTEAWHHTGG